MARQRLTPAAQMGVGAALGLVLASFTAQPGQAGGTAVPALVLGAVAGYVWSIVRQPMAATCRIPRWLGGCGGSSKVADGAGNWRPKRPCWRHPTGPPRRFGAILMRRAKPKERP